jgi:hypothetical protein
MSAPASSDRAYLERACQTTLAGLGACTAAALAWAQFRGFDMLDGAFYFLLYQNPGDNSDTQTRFHLLARPIWFLCRQNIVAFRFATLAIASIACWIFWIALRRLLPCPDRPYLCWWPLWLAAMAGLTWVPVALTYNSITMILGLLGLAIALSIVDPPAAGPLRGLVRCAMGLLLAGLLYGVYLAKVPAAAALAGSLYALACFDPNLAPRLRRALVFAGISIIAAVAAAGLYVVTRPGFGPDKIFLVHGLLFTPKLLYAIIGRYWTEILHLLPAVRGDFAWTIGPIILASVAALLGASVNERTRNWQSASLALLLSAFAGALLFRGLWDSSFAAAVTGEGSRFYFLFWGSLLPVWIICLWRTAGTGSQSTPQQTALVVIMLVLPLIGSFGSTNTVYVSALHETVFWAAGLLLVADRIAAAFSAPWFRPAVAALVSLAAAGQVFSGHFLRPYMYQPSLWKQTESVEIGFPATRLKVDPALAAFIREARTALDANGYKPGDDVFGFFNLPGVIFSIGAKEPGAPWYFGTWYHQENIDEIKLQRVPLKRRQHAWIVTQADLSQFRPLFLKCEIDFPDGYTRIAKTINPTTGLEIGIWKPRSRP